jgi:hypothetical protein
MAKKYREGDAVLVDGVEAGEVWIVLTVEPNDIYLIQNLSKTNILTAHGDTLVDAP